jgi:hypothetical protein
MNVLVRYRPHDRSGWSRPVLLLAPDGRTLHDPHIAPGVPLPAAASQVIERRLSEGRLPDALRQEWTEFSVGRTGYSFTTLTPQLRDRS